MVENSMTDAEKLAQTGLREGYDSLGAEYQQALARAARLQSRIDAAVEQLQAMRALVVTPSIKEDCSVLIGVLTGEP